MWEGVGFSSSEQVGNSLVGEFIVSKSVNIKKNLRGCQKVKRCCIQGSAVDVKIAK